MSNIEYMDPIQEVTPSTEKNEIEISDNSLTSVQKKLIALVYDKAKEAVETIISDQSLDTILKVTLMLGQIIKLLENITLDGNKIQGDMKKQVAIELGRLLIKDLVQEESRRATILGLYDLLADKTLETMVGVSKVLNVAVQNAVDNVVEEVSVSCCSNLSSKHKRVTQEKNCSI